MRSSPTGNPTLLRIQREISEVAERENEFRNSHGGRNSLTNGISDRESSPPPAPLTRAVSTSALNYFPQSAQNGNSNRRFIPNTNARGMMQKFFKSRGKISSVAAMTGSTPPKSPTPAWQPDIISSPSKALIPADKPLRKGYVPVEERIQKELREMKHREEELRTQRKQSQPNLIAALEDEDREYESSRSSSPIGRLRQARSYSQLLDDDYPEDSVSAPPSLRPARSLAELCDAADEEIESPRSLIQQWESRIKKAQM